MTGKADGIHEGATWYDWHGNIHNGEDFLRRSHWYGPLYCINLASFFFGLAWFGLGSTGKIRRIRIIVLFFKNNNNNKKHSSDYAYYSLLQYLRYAHGVKALGFPPSPPPFFNPSSIALFPLPFFFTSWFFPFDVLALIFLPHHLCNL